jgi:hypothetical protein
MAGKPSKWSSEVTQVSMEEDDELNKMAMDRETTRQHFEMNEIMSKEDKAYEAVVENEKRLRSFQDEPNRSAKTWRRVR